MIAFAAELIKWVTLNAVVPVIERIIGVLTDIITKIFSELGFNDFRLATQSTFEPMEYCVQYRETDFNFVHFHVFEQALRMHTAGSAFQLHRRAESGTIEVDTVAGEFSEFTIRLPRRAAAAPSRPPTSR